MERVFNHVIGGVRASYDYHDYYAEKKDALDAWASHLDRIMDAAPGQIGATDRIAKRAAM